MKNHDEHRPLSSTSPRRLRAAGCDPLPCDLDREEWPPEVIAGCLARRLHALELPADAASMTGGAQLRESYRRRVAAVRRWPAAEVEPAAGVDFIEEGLHQLEAERGTVAGINPMTVVRVTHAWMRERAVEKALREQRALVDRLRI